MKPKSVVFITGALAASLVASSAWAEQPTLLPGTPAGARQAIAHYASELLKPPFQVSSRPKATCTRYLPTALRTVSGDATEACVLTLRATKALAMCHWLGGRDEQAQALASELATMRCRDATSGLSASMWLAERWWRPESVRRFIHGQRSGLQSRGELLVKLDATKRRVARVRAALGAEYARRRGGLLVEHVPPGTPAGRVGLRPGDVIVSVAAKPVRSLDDIGKHLAGRTAALTSVLYYRDGERIEGAWPGNKAGALTARSLIERLP